jgi:hypothetical protein
MKYIFTGLLFTAVFFFACNETKQSPQFGTNNLKAEQFTVNTDRDTVLQTAKGALLKISKGALVSADGKPVKLDIKEAYSMADIIKAGLTTTTNGQPLSSGGMIYINAADGQQVTIKQAIQVALPSNNLNDSMKLYKGETTTDGKINWVEPKDLPENKQIAAIDRGELLYQLNCTSCHAIETKVVGPPLAHFLKRFPLPVKTDENYWGYRAHPYYGMLKRISNGAVIDSSWIQESDMDITTHSTDTSKKISKKKGRELQWLQWYECNMHNYSPTDGQEFSFTPRQLNNIYKYIQSESDRMNIPYEGGSAYENDKCFDSCQNYISKTRLLNKLKKIEEKKREEFIKQNGEMTNVIPDPTWVPIPPPPDDYSWKVSPNNYQATYYQFTVETFGWFNIDMLMVKLGDTVKESELFVTLSGEWRNRVNIFLIIPSYNVYGEGGPASRNPGEYAFFNKNGLLPLPQNEKAFILAVSEKNDKIGYALKEFRTGLTQKLEVEVRESTKEEFDQAITSLGGKQISVTVKPSLNADSIRATDKKIQDINLELKDIDKLKPKNCNCDCIEENMMVAIK